MLWTGARYLVLSVAVVTVLVLATQGLANAQDDPPLTELSGLVGSCGRASIEATNVGDQDSKAIAVFFGENTAEGPLKVECGGLMSAGDTWTFATGQIPEGAESADVYSFTTKLLSEIGVDLGFDDVTADFVCQTLFFSVVGDQSDYSVFKSAYAGGDDWMGVPLNLTYGAPLEVEASPALCTSHLPLTLRGQ